MLMYNVLTNYGCTHLKGISQDFVESGFRFIYICSRDEVHGVGGTSGVFRQVLFPMYFGFSLQCIMKLDGLRCRLRRRVRNGRWECIFNFEYEHVLLISLLGHRL